MSSCILSALQVQGQKKSTFRFGAVAVKLKNRWYTLSLSLDYPSVCLFGGLALRVAAENLASESPFRSAISAKLTVQSTRMMPICGTNCQLRCKIDFLKETHPLVTALLLLPSVNHWFGSSHMSLLSFQSTNSAATMHKHCRVTVNVCFIFSFCKCKHYAEFAC